MGILGVLLLIVIVFAAAIVLISVVKVVQKHSDMEQRRREYIEDIMQYGTNEEKIALQLQLMNQQMEQTRQGVGLWWLLFR
jgi:DNA integrity scanning protein DisA with diadenylate cyclase activity